MRQSPPLFACHCEGGLSLVAIPRKYVGADAYIRPNGIAQRDDVLNRPLRKCPIEYVGAHQLLVRYRKRGIVPADDQWSPLHFIENL